MLFDALDPAADIWFLDLASGSAPQKFLATPAYEGYSTLTDADRQRGSLFPALERIREVSTSIAAEVARIAYDTDLASTSRPEDLAAAIRAQMYDPRYDT